MFDLILITYLEAHKKANRFQGLEFFTIGYNEKAVESYSFIEFLPLILTFPNLYGGEKAQLTTIMATGTMV